MKRTTNTLGMEGLHIMGYYTSNAAYAYDMQPQPAPSREAAPRVQERPRFDVYAGEGRAANQAVSPVFTHVIKVFCVLVALFCTIGLGRVAIAGVTTAALNQNAAITSDLESAQDESASLEVMRSVYGADTRIRDLALGYGMVEPEGSVTLDFTADAAAGSSAATQ